MLSVFALIILPTISHIFKKDQKVVRQNWFLVAFIGQSQKSGNFKWFQNGKKQLLPSYFVCDIKRRLLTFSKEARNSKPWLILKKFLYGFIGQNQNSGRLSSSKTESKIAITFSFCMWRYRTTSFIFGKDLVVQ